MVNPTDKVDMEVVDLCNCGLDKIQIPPDVQPITIILDHNNIYKIDNICGCFDLHQLSAADNRLISMVGIERFKNLTVLNLPNNSISTIEGLKMLTQLSWLNLSGNSIKVIENLDNNLVLQHLDLSENNIGNLSDLSYLLHLRTLLLHGNVLISLSTASKHLPLSLLTLSLAENEINDLCEVSYLSSLLSLQQLSIMNNPCASVHGEVSYWPYVLSVCRNLEILDGCSVKAEDRLKGEWLLSQSKHVFKPGQHSQLFQYLAFVFPRTAAPAFITSELCGDNPGLVKCPNEQGQEVENPHQETISSGKSSLLSELRTIDRNGYENDFMLQDVNSEDFESKSNVSLLESESVYVPVSPVKSLTDEPGNSPELVSAQNLEHTDAMKDTKSTEKAENKYEAYDNRPVRPLNTEFWKGLVNPSFQCSGPQISDKEPMHGGKKRTPSPFSQAQDYDCIDREDSNKCKEENIPILKDKLNSIRDIAGMKKNKKSQNVLARCQSSRNASFLKKNTTLKKNASLHMSTMDRQEIKLKNKSDTFVASDLSDKKNSCLVDLDISSQPATKNLDTLLVSEQTAAKKIQAFWRGYQARTKDSKIFQVRLEIRCRRTEEHITILKSELARQNRLYIREKYLRMQMCNAVKLLWKEVQLLQEWRNSMTNNSNTNAYTCEASCLKWDQGVQTAECDLHKELTRTCTTLQAQVTQLQENFRSFVLRDGIQLCETDFVHPSPASNGFYTSISSGYFPPPTNLQLKHSASGCVTLFWITSRFKKMDDKSLLGYKIYVNDQPRGLVSAAKSQTLVYGLNTQYTYRFHVTAVFSEQESAASNVVTAQFGGVTSSFTQSDGHEQSCADHTTNKSICDYSTFPEWRERISTFRNSEEESETSIDGMKQNVIHQCFQDINPNLPERVCPEGSPSDQSSQLPVRSITTEQLKRKDCCLLPDIPADVDHMQQVVCHACNFSSPMTEKGRQVLKFESSGTVECINDGSMQLRKKTNIDSTMDDMADLLSRSPVTKHELTTVPIIDGRKRHTSSSRSSSPLNDNGIDAQSMTERTKRMLVAEQLLQCGSSSKSKSTNCSPSDHLGTKVLGVFKSASLECVHRDLLADNIEQQTPVMKQERTASVGSDGEISSTDSEKERNKNDDGNVIKKLLGKLHFFTRVHETGEKKSYRGFEGSPPEGQVRITTEDTAAAAPNNFAFVQSENIIGETVNPQIWNKGHRRTASDHKIVPFINSSPVMDGSDHGKKSTVRRHASFHGILPSKKTDKKNKQNLQETGEIF